MGFSTTHSVIWLELFFVTITLLTVMPIGTSAIACYVCQDCETSFNASHVVQCPNSTRCMKILNQNGVADRTCDSASKCPGRISLRFPTPRTRRSIDSKSPTAVSSSSQVEESRIKRSLLGGSPLQKEQGFNEAASIYCCFENECNGSPHNAPNLTLLLYSFIMLQVSILYYCSRNESTR